MINHMEYPSVLIILVNYNSYHETIECIQSLQSSKYKNIDIYILDNASQNDSVERITAFIEKFELTEHISLDKNSINIGFGGGVNQGIKYALRNGHDYVLLLNNDTIVSPDFLSKLMETVTKDESTGIVGGKILYYKSDKIYSAGGEISYVRNIGHLKFYNRQNNSLLTGEIDSTFVSGCLMLIRSSLIKDIGFFDEDYFMYVEDVDFCYRALKKGWKIKTNLDSTIWHKEGDSSNPEFSAYWGSKNRLKFIFKNLRRSERLKALILHFLSKPILYFKLKKKRLIEADIKGIIDFFKKDYKKMGGQLDDKMSDL